MVVKSKRIRLTLIFFLDTPSYQENLESNQKGSFHIFPSSDWQCIVLKINYEAVKVTFDGLPFINQFIDELDSYEKNKFKLYDGGTIDEWVMYLDSINYENKFVDKMKYLFFFTIVLIYTDKSQYVFNNIKEMKIKLEKILDQTERFKLFLLNPNGSLEFLTV